MPPRKRAASAPKDEPEQEPLAPDTDAGTESDDDGEDSAPASDDTSHADDGGEAGRSDVQTADQPCPECLPNGWPEGAFSVGCTHGTYLRKQD